MYFILLIKCKRLGRIKAKNTTSYNFTELVICSGEPFSLDILLQNFLDSFHDINLFLYHATIVRKIGDQWPLLVILVLYDEDVAKVIGFL